MAEHRRSPDESTEQRGRLGRRRVLGYLLAAPTLAVGVSWIANTSDPRPADAAVPSLPQPEDIFDLGDLQNLAAAPTSGLISVELKTDGTAFFAVPRAEVGQGMTTSIAMMVAEELDLPMDKITIGLADARPELLMNQLTGGSNSMRSMYIPVRTAAAIARQRLVETAAAQWGVAAGKLTTRDGVVSGPSGRTATYGSLAKAAASSRTITVSAAAQTPVRVHHPRAPAQPRRRSRHRHRPQAVRDGPRRPERQADDGVPATDDQRHGQGGPQPGRRRGDARHHRRRRSSPPAWPSAARRSASASTRSGPSTSTWGPADRWTASPTRRCSPKLAGRRAAAGRAAGRCSPRRSTPSSPSRSPATARSSRTAAIADVRADSAEIWAQPARSPIVAQRGDRHPARPAADRGEGARDRGRWLVRPASCSTTRRSRRREISKKMGKPVQTDVAPHRRRPRRAAPTRCATSRVRATLPRRQGAQLRAAAHQRGRPNSGTASARC